MEEKKISTPGTNHQTVPVKYGFIENPYRPFDLVSGEWFHHENIIEKIKNRFETQPEKRVIVLQGNPGSGKSCLLKRLANDRFLLGKNYIPIYLDTTGYKELDADELIYSVSKNVIEKLNEFGYGIPIPEYIKKRRIKTTTFESLLLLFDTYLNPGEKMVLILDEFDKLLENIDLQVISDYILLSRYIEKSWSNYGLILAGDKRLVNLTKSKVVNEFLETGFIIDIEEILEEEILKNLIVDPVKDRLDFEDDAIKKIIWFSGKNLYFQQLICQYIVDYLNEEKRNHCILKDVEEAVHRILKKPPKEYHHAWENKLSVEDRLIAAALGDDNIIEKKGEGYLLRENRLLDNILGNGLHTGIKKLQGFGYITEMQQNWYFPKYPFKFPSYGEWIRITHPFLKTVIENIEDIAEKIDLNLLVEEIEKIPGNRMTPSNINSIVGISRNWLDVYRSVVLEKLVADKFGIKKFIFDFVKYLNLEIREKPLPDLNCFIIEIKNLSIGILEEALCIIQDRYELTKNEINTIEDRATEFVEEAQTKLTLLFYFQASDMIQELVKKPYLSLIPIDETDIKKIILSDKPVKTFKDIILSRLSLDKVSPYQTEGPAKAIFYGRSDIIERISSSTSKSYAIVGARKIGKTSLLYRIKNNPPPNTRYIFMSLEAEFTGETKDPKSKNSTTTWNVKSYTTFLKSLKSSIERELKKKIDFRSIFFRWELSKLPKAIHKLSRNGKKIVFIFDEIDTLIEFDQKNNYKLMRLFRAMSQENYCQFIFAGFKELYHRKRDIQNPMYNFCEEIKLTPLNKEAASDLITKPMESIGIEYKNKADKDLILEYTGRHPNLLQFYCMKLIEKVGNHEKLDERRTIYVDDITEVLNTKYEEYIMDDVYMFRSDLSNIDRLVLILLAEDQLVQNEDASVNTNKNGDGKMFSTDAIQEKLSSSGVEIHIDNIHQILKNLVMRFILLEHKDKYSFALSIFPEILKNNIDDNFKTRVVKEIKKHEAKPL